MMSIFDTSPVIKHCLYYNCVHVRTFYEILGRFNQEMDRNEATKEEQVDSLWQDLTDIAADPPSQREICESCR